MSIQPAPQVEPAVSVITSSPAKALTTSAPSRVEILSMPSLPWRMSSADVPVAVGLVVKMD